MWIECGFCFFWIPTCFMFRNLLKVSIFQQRPRKYLHQLGKPNCLTLCRFIYQNEILFIIVCMYTVSSSWIQITMETIQEKVLRRRASWQIGNVREKRKMLSKFKYAHVKIWNCRKESFKLPYLRSTVKSKRDLHDNFWREKSKQDFKLSASLKKLLELSSFLYNANQPH